MSRPEPLTRKKQDFWDKLKFLVLFAILFSFLVWSKLSGDEFLSVRDAFAEALAQSVGRFLLAVAIVEILRQIHFSLSTRWVPYHQFWNRMIWDRLHRREERINPWLRFRLSRYFRWIFLLFVYGVVISALVKISFIDAFIQAPALLVQALPMLFQVIFIMMIAVGQFVAIFWFLSRGGTEVYYPEDVKTRFDDVWGQDHVKALVKESITFLEKPDEIEARGGYAPGGILLWGPPGTGKTLLAEAVAGETGKPFVFVEPSAFIAMFMGIGPMKVKALYRKLRRLSQRYGGVIVFFDEADSLGNRGAVVQQARRDAQVRAFLANASCNGGVDLISDAARAFQISGTEVPDNPGRLVDRIIMGGMGGGGGGMGTLQALLAEMSGLKKPRGFFNRKVRRMLGMKPKPPPKYRILTIMATNLPDALDPALLRPGRIDRLFKVPYPHKEGRKRTYEGYLAKVRNIVTDVEVDKLATISAYATGATIKDVVNEALIHCLREGREVVTYQDLLAARALKMIGPPEGFEYIEDERHRVAVHEAGHALVGYLVRDRLRIDIATIERRGNIGGFVSSVPLEERFTEWKNEFEHDIMVSLGSIVAERIVFAMSNSSGVTGDLISATSVSTAMEGFWGMGETLTSFRAVEAATGQRGSGMTATLRARGEQVEARLQKLYADTYDLITKNRHLLLAIADALETYKTISGEDIEAIMTGVKGPQVDGRRYIDGTWMLERGFRYRGMAEALPPPPEAGALPSLALLRARNGNGNGRNGDAHGPGGAGNGAPAKTDPLAPPRLPEAPT